MDKLELDWKTDQEKLSLKLQLDSFTKAVDLINYIGIEAEKINHHPNLRLYDYNYLDIEIYTHESNGLTDKDYLLASKIEQLVNILKAES